MHLSGLEFTELWYADFLIIYQNFSQYFFGYVFYDILFLSFSEISIKIFVNLVDILPCF